MKKNLLIAAELTTFGALSFAQGPTPLPTASAVTSTAKQVHKVKHAHTAKKAAAPVAAASVSKYAKRAFAEGAWGNSGPFFYFPKKPIAFLSASDQATSNLDLRSRRRASQQLNRPGCRGGLLAPTPS